MTHWTTANIPSQKSRSAVVTGTGGIGFEDALALARAGCDTIVAGRNSRKGAEAVAKICNEVPSAKVRFEQIDLASLESVTDFARRLRSQQDSLDLLINNAAVMAPPKRLETTDGFEQQFGVNYLSHFALTAQLMPMLCKGKNARVVTLSSIAARNGTIDFDDLQANSYKPMAAYSQSKLACLMFAFELQRRSEAGQWGVASFAAHPGLARTNLLYNSRGGGWSVRGILRSLLWFLFQPVPQGALPTLFAATSPDAKAGAYYGPHGLSETRGFPALSKVPPQAMDTDVAARLWQVSEKLTKIDF